MARSPVCDGPNFTLGLESAYRNMWRRYCKGDVPSQRHMEILQQELTTEEPAFEPVRITTSVAGSPGSIKSNGFNPLPTPMLNPSSCEENGVWWYTFETLLYEDLFDRHHMLFLVICSPKYFNHGCCSWRIQVANWLHWSKRHHCILSVGSHFSGKNCWQYSGSMFLVVLEMDDSMSLILVVSDFFPAYRVVVCKL